ncbi:hypothetical protein N7447_009503 [Penicillium robsamsonii]|uniref:uncharacterized protein n=1 Tax=Penicillium robsamsonii TaxID=1792511 RepID=UPI002546A907|nr:uncharacterized protein N7447_009503 [Penicillium robsamsonii]KAJ5817270.1 hypothetical protein N7447_009503 [Penicillium robsamsonii]
MSMRRQRETKGRGGDVPARTRESGSAVILHKHHSVMAKSFPVFPQSTFADMGEDCSEQEGFGRKAAKDRFVNETRNKKVGHMGD